MTKKTLPPEIRSSPKATLSGAMLFTLCFAFSLGIHGTFIQSTSKPLHQDDNVLLNEALTILSKNNLQGFDLGRFFIRYEIKESTRYQQHMLERWDQRVRDYQYIQNMPHLTNRDRLRWLLLDLFKHDNIGQYIRSSSTLSGFFNTKDPGGNCEAETKLIISAILASQIAFDGGDLLGVQLFDDHVQAVIYNRQQGTVWVPLTGEVQNEIQAPIYQPAILLHALLTGKNIKPPIKASSLLLASTHHAPRNSHGKGYSTDTNLSFPEAGVRHTTAEVAERTNISPPKTVFDPQHQTLVERTNVELRTGLAQENSISNERCPVLAIGVMHIRSENDVAFFNQLPTLEARANFVVEMVKQSVSSVQFNQDSLENLLEKKDIAAITKEVDALHRVLDAVDCGHDAIRSLAIASKVYAHQSYTNMEEPYLSFKWSLEKLPHVANARYMLEMLIEWFGENPTKAVHIISGLPHSLRAELLTLLPGDSQTYEKTVGAILPLIKVSDELIDVDDTIQSPNQLTQWVDTDDMIDALSQPSALPPTKPTPPVAKPITPPTPPTALARLTANSPVAKDRQPTKQIKVAKEILLDLLLFHISTRPATLVEGLSQDARKHLSPAIEQLWQQKRASAPKREQVYYDALSTLLRLPNK